MSSSSENEDMVASKKKPCSLSLFLSFPFLLVRDKRKKWERGGDCESLTFLPPPLSFRRRKSPSPHVPPLFQAAPRGQNLQLLAPRPWPRRDRTLLHTLAKRARPRECLNPYLDASVLSSASSLFRRLTIQGMLSSPALALAALVAHAPLAAFSLLAAFLQTVLHSQSGFM